MAPKKSLPTSNTGDPAAKMVEYLRQTGKSAHETVTWGDLIAAVRAAEK